VGYEPPTAAGAAVPFCAPCDAANPTGQLSCDAGTGKVGLCVSPGACDPGCGAICTPDGVTTLGLLPGSGC
jgi:hypothetical protein